MNLDIHTEGEISKLYRETLTICGEVFTSMIPDMYSETEVSIAIVSSGRIQELNNQYRGKNCVTDVLSFSQLDVNDKEKNPPLIILGEIFICQEQLEKQAQELGHSKEYELAVLCIHGLWHLLGYDHIIDKDYQIMKPLEEETLRQVLIRYPNIFPDSLP